MAALATQSISRAGLTPTFAAAAGGGDTVATSDTVFLVVKNADVAPVTVTVVTPGNVSGQAIADLAVSVGAGAEKWIGPISRSLFGNPANDYRASVTYSGVTSLTVGAISL